MRPDVLKTDVLKMGRNILNGLADLLRELSDQNAYQRHLAEHGVAHSPAEWRRFSDERFRMKYQQVKCC